jgi:hypothetical protein
MDISDYYCPETTPRTLGYNLGRGARAIRVVKAGAISPLKASAAVSAAWGGIAALINAAKYGQGRISKRDALLDTAGESAGMGVAAGLGLLASNAVRASVLIASTSSLIPFALGVVVTAGAKVIWDRTIKRRLRYQD